MEEQEKTEFRNPAEYLKIFFRRKWLLIVPIFLGVVISFAISLLVPPKYESSTVIMVEEEKIINPLIEGLAVSTSASQRLRTIKEQILGWNSLVELSKKLRLDKDVRTQLQFEKMILDLRRSISVQLRGANFIRISYISDNPHLSQEATSTLTDILIAESMRSQARETDVAINFIKEQLVVYKRKIKEAEIAQLEDQLKGLLVDSTEEHPMVKELRHKMEVAAQELQTGEFEVALAGEPINNPIVDALKRELDEIINKEKNPTSGPLAYAFADTDTPKGQNDPNTTIYKLMVLDKLDSVMARDIKVNEAIYNTLLQKLETAKITQRLEVSREGTRYTIIDPARLPLKPSKPNKILIVFLGMFLGTCSGAGLVLGREFLDQSILDIEEAKRALDLPILGAISRLTTQDEVEKIKLKKKALIASFLIVSFLIVFAAAAISFFRH